MENEKEITTTEATVAETKGLDVIVDESNVDTFKLFNIQGQLNDLIHLSEDVKERQNVGRGEIDYIDDRIKPYTVEQLKGLSNEEIISIATAPEGEGSNLDFSNITESPEANIDLIREYIVFRKETNNTLESLDDDIAKLRADIAEYDDEMKKLLDDFNDLTSYAKHILTEKIKNTEDGERKKLYSDMCTALDSSLTLKPIIDYYSNPANAANVVANFKIPKKCKQMISRYTKVSHKVKCKTDFTKIENFEVQCLPEEYQTRPDIFIQAIITYMASLYKYLDDNRHMMIDGLFLTQVAVYTKNLLFGNFTNEEDKKTFKEAVCTVVKMVS